MKKHRNTSDWKSYWRLLGYLKGTGWVVVALLVCMVLEAGFTAASIGMVKPLIEIAAGKDEKWFKPSEKQEESNPSAMPFVNDLKEYARTTVQPYIHDLQVQSKANPIIRFKVLAAIIAIMLTFGLLMILASFGTGYFSSYLSSKAVQRLRNHAFSHIVNLDMGYFSTHSTGTLMSLVIHDVQTVDGALNVLFSSVIKNPIKVLTFIVMMIVISPSLTFITFLIIPFIGLTIYLIGLRIRRVSRRVQMIKALLSSILEEAFTGMRVIKGYNMENIETRRFEKKTRDVFRMGLKTTVAEEIGSGLTQFLGLVAVGVVVIVGAYYVEVKQELSGGDFVMFALLLTQIFRPLKGASKITSKVQTGLAGCDRVFAVLDTKPTIIDKPNAVAAQRLSSSLRFDNVTFMYSTNNKPALRDINLTIPAGSAIALVGETGSGKSTLTGLIPRFFDTTEGQVFYDNTPLQDLQIKSLRNQLALVTQEVVLFDDTVANNIAYGIQRPVEQEEIEQAARAAMAHDFILRMPEGYNTTIGSRGARLSGGERQRLAIARAILKDAPILILDEATSALDSETEALVQKALTNLIKGRTTIVIAHRLSTIQNCDRIYVLDQGRIIEEGTHQELLNRNGRYARFHRIQYSTPDIA